MNVDRPMVMPRHLFDFETANGLKFQVEELMWWDGKVWKLAWVRDSMDNTVIDGYASPFVWVEFTPSVTLSVARAKVQTEFTNYWNAPKIPG